MVDLMSKDGGISLFFSTRNDRELWYSNQEHPRTISWIWSPFFVEWESRFKHSSIGLQPRNMGVGSSFLLGTRWIWTKWTKIGLERRFKRYNMTHMFSPSPIVLICINSILWPNLTNQRNIRQAEMVVKTIPGRVMPKRLVTFTEK